MPKGRFDFDDYISENGNSGFGRGHARGLDLKPDIPFSTVDVEELAHRRVRAGRDLDEVQAELVGLLDRFVGEHDAEGLAVLVDDANLVGLNKIVEFGSGFDRGREHAPGWTGYGLISCEPFFEAGYLVGNDAAR